MRQVGAVVGNGLSSSGFAAQSQQRHRTQPLRAAHVSTHKGSVTPKSHQGDGVSQHSWHFGCLWISRLQGVPWITALLPCLSGPMAILGALWFLISVSVLSKSTRPPRTSCKSHFMVFAPKKAPACS